MGKLDSLGRATFHHIAPLSDVRPTNREIRWLKHIERHGPQCSAYLHELTRDTHRCRDTALRDLQKLRAGGFLSLPTQQLRTERAECNPYVYDLTPKAKRWLADQGLAELTVRPVGHWWHAYATSCVTGAIDIEAQRLGVRYIPAHEILARNGAALAIPIGRERLIPDQLFALDYGGSFRAFVLEVDRGTEPIQARDRRRTIDSMLTGYQSAYRSQAAARHYGLRCPIVPLILCTTPGRASMMRERATRLGEPIASVLVVGTAPTDMHRSMPRLFSGGWLRASGKAFSLGVTVGD
ncbi:MAG: replication-relaxation family protein [Albidovulum sp.]|uniref:replication-relaxation family protein n=1 Tax=Albidovulum sp. TaxID=1872424 RepID=UPI003C9FA456